MKMRWGGRVALMDARVEAERETADEGWPGRRREDRKEGKRKSSGNQSCKSPVHC